MSDTHRYPGSSSEHTAVLPPFVSPGAPEPPRRRRRGTVGVLLGALLLGGAGGVAGAAGFSAWDDDSASGTTPATRAVAPLRTSGGSSSDAPAADGSAEQVAAEVLPSVVKINVRGPDGNGGSGSGVILSADGEILTNNHVAEAVQGGRITVNFNDGSAAEATVVGTDPVTDLAVIKAQDVSGLTPAVIGDSDALQVGEGVVAVGSPFGLAATVTSGIVSSLNRPVSVDSESGGEATTYPAIQTDAAINPGNSGGPLVDMTGAVVGINSSIRTSSAGLGEGGSIGLGFAIPISKVVPIVEQLRAGEQPTHARLGVSVSDDTGGDGLVSGAGIQDVTSGSSGDKAGLRAGDIVTRVDDEPVTGTESLIATIRGYRPGDTVDLTVVRGGKTLTVAATLDSDQ